MGTQMTGYLRFGFPQIFCNKQRCLTVDGIVRICISSETTTVCSSYTVIMRCIMELHFPHPIKTSFNFIKGLIEKYPQRQICQENDQIKPQN